MRISDIRSRNRLMIELEAANSREFEGGLAAGSEVLLHWSQMTDEYLVRIGDQVWSVRGADERNDDALKEICHRDSPRLCWLAGQHSGHSRLIVQVLRFAARYDLPDLVEMGVNDEIVEKADASLLSGHASVGDVLDWLTEETVLGTLGGPAILISAGDPSREGLAPHFSIHGATISVDVTRRRGGGYEVTRVTRARQHGQRPLMLLRGEFSYEDATVSSEFRGRAQTLLDSIVQQHDSYLALWHEYNRLERTGIVTEARECGYVRYQAWEGSPDGEEYSFRLQSPTSRVLQSLQDCESLLEAAEHLPTELTDDRDDGAEDSAARGSSRSFVGHYVRTDKRTLVLRPGNPDHHESPPEDGYIFVSLIGDRVRLKRREEARDQITQAANPMPTLGLLLEGRQAPIGAHRRIRAQWRDVRAVFDGEPTPRQEEAIEIALNTPDIAVIQGPPGTGKTCVIAAIERILARDSDSRRSADRVLLTSYQHDAVEHAAGYPVLDLPPIKMGGRSGRMNETGYTSDNVKRWLRDRINQLEQLLEAYPEGPARASLRDVSALAAGYFRSPGPPQETADLVEQVFDLAEPYITPELRDRLIKRAYALRSGLRPLEDDQEERELALRAVRALRTDADSFADDGPLTALKVLRRLEGRDLLAEPDRAVLDRAARWTDEREPAFLSDVEALQERLLDKLTRVRVLDQAGLINQEIEALLFDVRNALKRHVRNSEDGVGVTIEDYLHDLRYDREGVRDTLRHYTAVLAATCQQCVSRPMDQLKTELGVEFDTVIVDEAARANPLDLMIPMALASRRIVLVGDQRQLPHILEPDVERQLDSSQESTRDVFEESLFGRLFRHMTQLERNGAPKRAITLNAQYRMHPVLGKFVSETFYPPEEQFSSPRPPSEFKHGLEAYGGKVAAWINVPYDSGGERGRPSKYRTVEARRVAQEADGILQQSDGLSVGVITFYKAQERKILRSLQKKNYVEEIDGVLQVAREWRSTEARDGSLVERLRVGTVDAFQGKEFDVIILSMTRSNRERAVGERDYRRKYGFLTLENRLCVAMSRQKRLLIVVGDAGMVNDESAAQAIPGLKKFYDLCGSNHGRRL